jgi:hypothetical protein
MKRDNNKILVFLIRIISILLLLFAVLTTNAQNCAKKKLATKEMRLEFDYRGQSLFLEMSNGDTTTLNVVLYSKQNYRIFVVGEQKLGNINFKVIVPRKKFNRVMSDVKPKKVPVYRKDPNGFYLYNFEGERILEGEETIMDTSWIRETTSIKELVYNSEKAEEPYWTAKPNKTQLITIKVSVDKAAKKQKGCVGVYVGREYSNTYQFRR